MIPRNADRLTPKDVRQYRKTVDALIASCLELIREYPLPDDAGPGQERSGS